MKKTKIVITAALFVAGGTALFYARCFNLCLIVLWASPLINPSAPVPLSSCSDKEIDKEFYRPSRG